MGDVFVCLRYRDPDAAIGWLTAAFGMEAVFVVDDGGDGGAIRHAELKCGDDLVVIGPLPEAPVEGDRAHSEYVTGPGYTYVVVSDPDAHHAQAQDAGARIVRPLSTEPHGSRGYTALDLERNVWSFGTSRPSGPPAAMKPPTTSVRRIVPNVYSPQISESVRFFEGLGLGKVMDTGWIVTVASSSNPTAQISVIEADPSGHRPTISVEVDDVDSAHERLAAAGVAIIYPLTDETWGVRRFFAMSPEGTTVNILSHRA